MEEFNSEATDTPGFVAAVQDKGKEKRTRQRRRKHAQRPWLPPPRGEQRKFGGFCNWCWRIGHKEAQCWFKQEYLKQNPDSTQTGQRDIRDWTAGGGKEKGKGKGKQKRKGKGKGNGITTRKRTRTGSKPWLNQFRLKSAIRRWPKGPERSWVQTPAC